MPTLCVCVCFVRACVCEGVNVVLHAQARKRKKNIVRVHFGICERIQIYTDVQFECHARNLTWQQPQPQE